jgi:hypothetical protein
MDSDRPRGRRYRLVLRGEPGEPFGFLFEGMQMEWLAGHHGADRHRDRPGASARAPRANPGEDYAADAIDFAVAAVQEGRKMSAKSNCS